jgi:hypothetical protein
VRADVTVTFAFAKRGHYLAPGAARRRRGSAIGSGPGELGPRRRDARRRARSAARGHAAPLPPR